MADSFSFIPVTCVYPWLEGKHRTLATVAMLWCLYYAISSRHAWCWVQWTYTGLRFKPTQKTRLGHQSTEPLLLLCYCGGLACYSWLIDCDASSSVKCANPSTWSWPGRAHRLAVFKSNCRWPPSEHEISLRDARRMSWGKSGPPNRAWLSHVWSYDSGPSWTRPAAAESLSVCWIIIYKKRTMGACGTGTCACTGKWQTLFSSSTDWWRGMQKWQCIEESVSVSGLSPWGAVGRS